MLFSICRFLSCSACVIAAFAKSFVLWAWSSIALIASIAALPASPLAATSALLSACLISSLAAAKAASTFASAAFCSSSVNLPFDSISWRLAAAAASTTRSAAGRATGVSATPLIAMLPLPCSFVTASSFAASLIACCAFANSSLTLRTASAFSSLVNAALRSIPCFLVSAACATAAKAAGLDLASPWIAPMAARPASLAVPTNALVSEPLIALRAFWTASVTAWIAFACSSAVNSLFLLI